MSKWIDAEWLSKLFPDTGEGEWTYNVTALGYIDSAPSIDIVRCKECKWRGEEIESGNPYHWCRLVGAGYEVDDIHFCSYGERKESE